MRGPLPFVVAWPPDAPAWGALVVAVAVAVGGPRLFRLWLSLPSRVVTIAAAGCAFLLSLGYVFHYLRGGPRIIDATSYWLQARALAEGHFTWPVETPSASVRGRFLLSQWSGNQVRVGVIFPPGYPLVLAFGFLLGAPMLIGPAIAAATAWATFALARIVVPDDPAVARLAIVFSVVCAVLRYHTADTMSHGLAALLVTIAALCASKNKKSTSPTCNASRRFALLAGFAWGWLVATRPLSGAAIAPALVWMMMSTPAPTLNANAHDAGRFARLGLFFAGSLPLLAFFLVEQHAVTGEWLASSQSAYYALSDGPPGCFRLGFGPDVGCLHEHGSFVSSRLPGGFGLLAATLTTLRRLRQHAVDLLNAEPLVLLFFAGAWFGRKQSQLRPLLLASTVLPFAYLPFYFDASYPGGGARLLADALPLEHVIAAYGVSRLTATWADAPQRSLRARSAPWIASLSIAMALAGFALRTSLEHVALASREGGQPMFAPSAVARAGVDHGLLFVNTDHGFDLAYDPDALDAGHHLVVARPQDDARDALVWDKLGRPDAFRYAPIPPTITRWSPDPEIAQRLPPGGPSTTAPRALFFELEAEWPPLAQSGGFFEVAYATGTCASAGRVLAARPSPGGSLRGILELPVPSGGRFRVRPRITYDPSVVVGSLRREEFVVARLVIRSTPPTRFAPLADHDPAVGDGDSSAVSAPWSVREQADSGPFRCIDLPFADIRLSGTAWLDVEIQGAGLGLDSIEIEPEATPAPREPGTTGRQP